MEAITYTKARATLAQPIDSVCENHEPVIITKKNDRSVVMLSLRVLAGSGGHNTQQPLAAGGC